MSESHPYETLQVADTWPDTGRRRPNAPHVLERFNRQLQSVNTHSAISRRDPILPPRLRILAPRGFAQSRQRQFQKGMLDSQLKFPDRSCLEGLQVEQEVRLAKD